MQNKHKILVVEIGSALIITHKCYYDIYSKTCLQGTPQYPGETVP